VREEFAKTKLANEKELIGKVAKMGETKKAMPFVQGLRKRILTGERAEGVFERALGFDEVGTLGEMVRGLRRTTGCRAVEVVLVEEGGKAGRVEVAAGGEDGGRVGREVGERVEGLPGVAEAAVPGHPSFHFENVV